MTCFRRQIKIRVEHVDKKAVQSLKNDIGLQYPIVIKPLSIFKQMLIYGNYNMHPQGMYWFHQRHVHVISLYRNLSLDQMNLALWHELCHAAQAEEIGCPKRWKELLKADSKIPYLERQDEIEAISVSEIMAPRRSLVR